MPVVVQGPEGLLGSVAPGVGSFIKLRNIGVRVVQGQLQVRAHGRQGVGHACSALLCSAPHVPGTWSAPGLPSLHTPPRLPSV